MHSCQHFLQQPTLLQDWADVLSKAGLVPNMVKLSLFKCRAMDALKAAAADLKPGDWLVFESILEAMSEPVARE